MTLIKSISGIRGTIGGPATENLTPLDIVKFTTAYVRFIAESAPGKRLKIVVGRDARISGEMVGDIIEGTLLGCGADVVNVGLCTTPGTELAVTAHRADGGIIITASHNPRQWNALKLLNADGEFLSDAEGKRVLALGEKLPSVRSLAMDLAINPNTIQRAYAQLEMEGYVYSVAGRGTFVAEGQEQNLVRRREVEAKVQPLVQELRELGMTEGEWIALWRGGNENA